MALHANDRGSAEIEAMDPARLIRDARHHVRLAIAALRRHPTDPTVTLAIECLVRTDHASLTRLVKGWGHAAAG
jgi:hypothetical protein